MKTKKNELANKQMCNNRITEEIIEHQKGKKQQS